MLLDLVIQSVNEFQADCLKFCERHYPTIHNQGMTEHHLALAFTRRLARTLTEFGHNTHHCAINLIADMSDEPNSYRVTSDMGTVWIISHHLVSAGKASQEKLVKSIAAWQQEYGFAIQPNDLLLIVSDHWITRSTHSRGLLYWWTGQLPDQLDEYIAQGITLFESSSQLSTLLENHYQISPCFVKYLHPLKHSRDQSLVRKYIQLFAVMQWS